MTKESLGTKIVADLMEKLTAAKAKVSALEKERDHLKALSDHAHEHWAIQGKGRIAAEARAEALEGIADDALAVLKGIETPPEGMRGAAAKDLSRYLQGVAAHAVVMLGMRRVALDPRCPTCGSTDRKVSLWVGKPVNAGSEWECLNPWHAALESPRPTGEVKDRCTGTLAHSEFVPCHDH